MLLLSNLLLRSSRTLLAYKWSTVQNCSSNIHQPLKRLYLENQNTKTLTLMRFMSLSFNTFAACRSTMPWRWLVMRHMSNWGVDETNYEKKQENNAYGNRFFGIHKDWWVQTKTYTWWYPKIYHNLWGVQNLPQSLGVFFIKNSGFGGEFLVIIRGYFGIRHCKGGILKKCEVLETMEKFVGVSREIQGDFLNFF